MILRLWRGWTTKDNADTYEQLLNGTIAPGIMQRGIAGLNDLSVLKGSQGEEVEFLTVMTFDDWGAVEEFAGTDKTASVVPPAARAVLSRFDAHSQHYELLERHLPATTE
jgi:hypothetical protein